MRDRSLLVEQMETRIALDGASVADGVPFDPPPVHPPAVGVSPGPPVGIPVEPIEEVPVGRPDDAPMGPPDDVPVGRPDDVPRGNQDDGDPCEVGVRLRGFWTNKHGRELIESDLSNVLALLNDFSLRNTDGSDAQFESANDIKAWLRTARARNMANMLSAQLAAMALNVHFGLVSGSALVEAAGTMSANALGKATIISILAEANSSLAANGSTTSGVPERPYQELLKDVLDDANNSNLGQSTGCPEEGPAADGPPADVPRGKGPPFDVPRGKGPPADVPRGNGPPADVPRGNGPPDFVREKLFAARGLVRTMSPKPGRGSSL